MRWLARGEDEVPADDGWLSPAESARSAEYRFAKRRGEYRLRRWAGKQAVAACAGLDPSPGALAAVEVLNRPTGVPYVLVDGVPLGVGISLADRAGWAVCLVGDRPDAEVGVDLELVEPRSDAFLADFLTPSERELVLGGTAPPGGVVPVGRDVLANLVWSAKESALKVLRTGLRADTRSVEVRLTGPARDDGWAPLEVHALAAGHPLPGWWRRDGRFVLTVAHAPGARGGGADGPPEALAATADLAAARPAHGWVSGPLTS